MVKKESKINIANLSDALFNCSRCGNCLAVCPIYKQTLDESVTPRGKLSLLEAVEKGTIGYTDKISKKIYTCTLCNYCANECPSGVDLKEIFKAARLDLVDSHRYPEVLDMLKKRIAEGHNVTFDTNEGRADWVKQLPGAEPEQFLKDKAEVVYFVGCVSSFSPRTFSIPRSIIQIFQQAEVDFTLLGEQEWCCGFPLLSAGMEEEARELARFNIATVKQKGAKILVTSCPSCYHTWKHEYSQLAGEDMDFEVMHISQYLLSLIKEGRLDLGPMDIKVTYHDPCDLGRNSGVFEEPREVIGAVPGLQFVELAKNRAKANCCGGGGNLESLDADLAAEIAGSKAREIIETDADVVISGCQQCERTISTALKKKKKDLNKKIKVWDIAELVLNSLESKK
ncbi:MAG: (Fe-S)-binding protein [Actinomycetota bacterium]|nr:(Fe-S)-binding protein [Actinomycetota bacterium]